MKCKRLGALHWINPETLKTEPLSAGSGLVTTPQSLWVVADDLNHLVRLDREDLVNGKGFAVFSGELPNDFEERKRVKPDAECLFRVPSCSDRVLLLAFPSGSKPQRNRASLVEIDGADEFVGAREVDVSPFIEFLDRRIPDLNIEGGTVLREKVIFLQRGNGKAAFNGVISFDLEVLESIIHSRFDPTTFNPVISENSLPKIDGVHLTFTDACARNGIIYFSAAAETGSSTYQDGEIIASVIGSLKQPGSEILGQLEKVKIEGVAVTEEANALTFLAVTDADDASKPSELLEISTDWRR